jgi:hypothetical protein
LYQPGPAHVRKPLQNMQHAPLPAILPDWSYHLIALCVMPR